MGTDCAVKREEHKYEGLKYCLILSFFLQGFLVESKLTKLLAPLERDEQSLMKLDAIFAVRKLLRCLEF